MRSFALVVVLSIFFPMSSTCVQASEQIDRELYKHVKVKLNSGIELRGKNLSINPSEIKFTAKRSNTLEAFALGDVEGIEISTKNYAPHFAIAGAAVGYVVASIIASTQDDGVIHYRATVVNNRVVDYKEEGGPMSTNTKIAIAVGGSAIGALIGYSIKGGWQKIFPAKAESNGISLGNSLPNISYNSLFAMRFIKCTF